MTKGVALVLSPGKGAEHDQLSGCVGAKEWRYEGSLLSKAPPGESGRTSNELMRRLMGEATIKAGPRGLAARRYGRRGKARQRPEVGAGRANGLSRPSVKS